ncbi:MAG TPA: hypothetical protein EYQ27_04130, partial [Gemmatimonadetes bacterium]|nr:hypothetical protein [Gemmatimonadota bacterium]
MHSLAPVDADLLGDLRFALRGLRRSPLITVAILVTIALGVGANTAIFSVVDAVMIRSLPFPDPERLVLLYETEPPGATLQPFSPSDLEDIAREASTLQSISCAFIYPHLLLVQVQPECSRGRFHRFPLRDHHVGMEV